MIIFNTVTGPRYVVELGEKVLDYNEKFRLFLATRSPESQLPPNVASILAIINFTTTRAGLTGQVNKHLSISLKLESSEKCIPSEWLHHLSLCFCVMQLLAATLQVEKPELEVRRTDLLRQEEDLKIQLVTLEDQLLTSLAESQGNILENKVIIYYSITVNWVNRKIIIVIRNQQPLWALFVL